MSTIEFCTKKSVSAYVYLSSEWSYKDCHLLTYYNFQKLGSRFTWGWTLPKISICFKWRKSRSRCLLMFSNMFRKLSVSPSTVNSYKVTNLCKNGIYIRKIWRDARFLSSKFGKILLHSQISRWVKNENHGSRIFPFNALKLKNKILKNSLKVK